MNTARSIGAVVAVLLGTAGSAHALKPATHADVTSKACKAVGLPGDFCKRAATADYDTDGNEWDDLAAHAQIADQQTACDAADLAAQRVWQLATQLRGEMFAVRTDGSETQVGKVGELLGRAVHTIQDDCAHHGMPNPQHAWFSLIDFCESTSLSPDVQPEAIACARTETAALMTLVAAEIARDGVASRLGAESCPAAPYSNPKTNSNQQAVCDRRYLPGPIDACSFLGEAKDWDGIDHQWNSDVVVPRLRDAFARGLAGQDAPASICGGDERVLSPAVSEPVVDVSGGPQSCVQAHLFCLGKADDSVNPFAGDVPDEVAGCAVGHGNAGGLVLVVGALVAARRRRRR